MSGEARRFERNLLKQRQPRAARLHPRAGPQRRPGRRLLPADRARAVADLCARRHRQSRAWRLLRHRRLSRGDPGGPHRFRRRVCRVAARGRSHWHRGRAPVVSSLLSVRPDFEPAPDFRARDGDRARLAHRLRRSSASISIPPELRGQIFVGDFIYSRYRLIILCVAIAAVDATWFIVYHTAFGRVVRAGVQNPDVVGALGISLAPYMTAIAALGVGLAGLAGVLLAPIAGVHPAMGAEILTAAFVVVVIGG